MATIPRLFIAGALGEGHDCVLAPEQAHYLGTVLRRRLGDPVLLFNTEDGEYTGEITALGRGRGRVALARQTRTPAAEPGPWLVFAPLKRDATDLLVRMATELGVEAFLPVMTERTNTARINLERLIAIVVEAAEQSERLSVPRFHPLRPLGAVLDDWPSGRTLFAAIERQEAAPSRPTMTGDAALLVGPEGGFSPSELDALHGSPIVRPISLGRLILRAETACVAGLALLRAPPTG